MVECADQATEVPRDFREINPKKCFFPNCISIENIRRCSVKLGGCGEWWCETHMGADMCLNCAQPYRRGPLIVVRALNRVARKLDSLLKLLEK